MAGWTVGCYRDMNGWQTVSTGNACREYDVYSNRCIMVCLLLNMVQPQWHRSLLSAPGNDQPVGARLLVGWSKEYTENVWAVNYGLFGFLLVGKLTNWWDDSQDKLDLFHRWVKLEGHIFCTDSYAAAWMRSCIWPVGCLLTAGDHSPVHRAVKGPIHVRWRYQQCGLFKYTAHGWTKYFILGLFLYFLKKECFPVSCLLSLCFSQLSIKNLWCVNFYAKIWEKRNRRGRRPRGCRWRGHHAE